MITLCVSFIIRKKHNNNKKKTLKKTLSDLTAFGLTKLFIKVSMRIIHGGGRLKKNKVK